MVDIHVRYTGGLRCEAVHGPSGARLTTDAPLDNHGRGESFSPSDLVATALGACMLTIMGIVAERHGWDMQGASARVKKEMVASPVRRIGRLVVVIAVPGVTEPAAQEALRKAALACPVHQSLRAEIELPIEFEFGQPVRS
ncbi:MAG: OsmC family peroxiredoxin [Planctomycetota bacterium]|nr:MAG: OsmC family peroxiredoxin [Planctomycetota bacterium]